MLGKRGNSLNSMLPALADEELYLVDGEVKFYIKVTQEERESLRKSHSGG